MIYSQRPEEETMMAIDALLEGFYGSVTVGERGQVVIPASLREKQGIQPGDRLLVFGHPSGHGVMLAKLQDLQRITELLAPILKSAENENSSDADPEQ
jgi:AbrB family looped-hinge helix DNA binding protein